MTKKLSFTKYERKILPDYRQKINNAESTEDVKNFFIYTVNALFFDVFTGEIIIDDEDIRLAPENNPPFLISPRLRAMPVFAGTWKNSDLSNVICRLAETAVNRNRRLEKHPEKTDSKRQRRYENR